MSAETSVPRPRESDVDISDSALFKGMLSEAEFAFAFFDADSRIQRVNDVFSDVVNVPAERMVGRQPVEVLAADLSQIITHAVQAVIETDAPVTEGRVRVRSAEGDTRHWSLSFSPVHDDAGELRAIALVGLDVTESRQTEEALRRSEERYRSLVEAQSQLVWITSPTGAVVEDAPQWRAITGQGLEEYLANGWLEVVHPEERQQTEEAWREALRGRLTDQLGAAALRTARLQGATAMLAEALTVEQVVQVIIDVGRTALAADRSAVALLDTDRAALKLINGEGILEASGATGDEIPLSHSNVMTMAVNSRRPVFAESPESLKAQLLEAGGDEEVLAGFLAHGDERAWVGLPLLAAGRALGALRFSFTRPQKISQEDGVFLEALAGQCALAVERATLFEREHRTAETLQRSLLPDRLPVVKGLVLAQRFRSGSRHVQVGGDWYDAFVLQDGRVAAVVGDVMGKGVKAAAGMGRIRNAMRALALTNPPPAAVLTGLDRVFEATEEEEQVTTLAYMVVEPVTGEGTLALAGHPPPVLVSPQGTAILCDAEPGTPLGWPTSRRQFRFVVPPGHTAVLYSDGLVENRKRGLDAGLAELCSVVTEAPPEVVSSPHMLLDFLVDRMLSGYEQDDDVTALAIHVPPATKSD
ncbi:peptidylprolyl isomerase [[Actinomadura] parvosata subsp. kistnae]|uniref:Peptidylprolyl isomerase n=1 Tax=[Actinomadura] parvosata subsp. kistnae TaxID=1909395 RepID=A0A1V0AI67_9ACTN|nr:SpoIIE family protein phosphatase [Nonomuraea sp. ATCC 55076]AQZ69908.1 peptidylprolyl isomerase [Nonomuraea sp. ATCC 55076]